VRLFAWLPDPLPAEFQQPFDASFNVRLGREHVMDWDYVSTEIGYIQVHLRTTECGVFLYQTDYFRVKHGHPIPKAPGEQLLSFDRGLSDPQDFREEIWVIVDTEFHESESIRLAYHRGMWPQHGLGVLTSLSTTSPDLKACELASLEIMVELSARARTLIVPAWRGDAFIFVEWPRD
jgi:hypothetical protein